MHIFDYICIYIYILYIGLCDLVWEDQSGWLSFLVPQNGPSLRWSTASPGWSHLDTNCCGHPSFVATVVSAVPCSRATSPKFFHLPRGGMAGFACPRMSEWFRMSFVWHQWGEVKAVKGWSCLLRSWLQSGKIISKDSRTRPEQRCWQWYQQPSAAYPAVLPVQIDVHHPAVIEAWTPGGSFAS